MLSRRSFFKSGLAAALLPLIPSTIQAGSSAKLKPLLRPKALPKGGTVGLVTPASPLFEAHRTVMEAKENMERLGLRVKIGKNIYKKHGYLAGSVEERVSDLHDMFLDPQVDALVAIRGGYGSAQLCRIWIMI